MPTFFATDLDDQKRGRSGVVCSLHETEEGHLRLVLDDVDNEGGADLGPWRQRALYTFKDLDLEGTEDLQQVSREVLAGIGSAVLLRLLVMREYPTP